VDSGELVARARVVALPMRERFRGIETREALLIEGENAMWAEWSPFVEYDDAEAARWLGSALAELGAPFDSDFDSLRSLNSRSGTGAPLPERAQRVEGPATIRVNATVPAVSPDAVPGVLARFPGTRTAKVKVAERGQILADDLARVRAVRDALGPDGRIRIDANAAWSLDEATTALEALAAFDLEYAEQPVASVADLGALRRRLAGLVRIAADESIRKPADPLEVVRAGAADVVVLKAQPLGGAARALEIVQRARAEADVAFVTSSALETSVGLASAARFARAVDMAFSSDLDHGLGTAALLAADVTTEPLLPVDGLIPLRRVVPDPELLERYAAAPERTAFWLERLRRALRLA